MTFRPGMDAGDWLAAFIAVACFVGIAALTISVSKWCGAAAGMLGFAFWAWVRLDTGVWLDDFTRLSFTISPRPAQQDSRPPHH